MIDELSIWGVALTEEEIQNYFGRALSGFEEGLFAHYNFNEASGDSLKDITGYTNLHGIINGANYTDGVPLEAPVNPDPEIFAPLTISKRFKFSEISK